MFICEIWLFDWYFPQFCTSAMSKYRYLEVFQRVPLTSRQRESTVFCYQKEIYFSRYVWEHLEVGYVQGMCDLLAPLLVILDDGKPRHIF